MSDSHPKEASFTDLPPEILLERLLPILEIKDLLSLSQTNKTLHSICNDESHWLHRTRLTFSYNPHTLAPASPGSGWSKRLFIGLSRPEPYVWGSADNDRLGLPEVRSSQGGRVISYRRKVTRPETLMGQFGGEGRRWVDRLAADLQGARLDNASSEGRMYGEVKGKREVGIVEMHGGGWSFAARDVEGRVWVWGQLDGDMPGFRPGSWMNKHERVPEPTPIPLPCRAEAISVGRCHMLILDEDNLIWEMRDWGRAYHHTSPFLTSPTNCGSTRRPHHIVQLSTGWSHSACLTSSGKIYVWYPFSGRYEAGLTVAEEMIGPLGLRGQDDESRAVRCGTVKGEVITELEALPARPQGDDGGAGSEEGLKNETEWAESTMNRGTRENEEAEKVVKIASGQGFVVALKANGEVWFRSVEDGRESEWEFLPFFSSPRMSHITAQFTSLTSYSTSTPSRVFHARLPPDTSRPGFGRHFQPDALPSLQGKGVIQVAIGDYHFAALTSQGEMWTWGQGSAGQLGLGEVGGRGEVIDEPRRVQFSGADASDGQDGQGDSEDVGEKFVFAITAAGWHTGALVLGSNGRRKKLAGKTKLTLEEGVGAQDEDEGYPRYPGSGIVMPGAFPDTRPQTFGHVDNTQATGSAGTSRPGAPLLPGGMPPFRIGLAGGHAMGIAAELEPQFGGGLPEGEQQQIPMLDQLQERGQGQGPGSNVQRNWTRFSRSTPSRQGDEM